ncbi:cytochrome P450 85A1-like [Oryza brachyantha]|uniref:cytochrome P450 85A1-like n=1 Tax=Oryza brachyantha TaxID=4533 RepID=UPI001ADC85DD|nr:cytochrome P450 85A1-like [Oryza brachyantha]
MEPGLAAAWSWSWMLLLLLALLLLALSCSWWKRLPQLAAEAAAAAPLPPPAAGPGAGGGSWLMRWVWQWRETAAFLAAHGSGRGFYHFVHARYLRHGPCFRTALLGRVHVFLPASAPAAYQLLAAEPSHFAKRYARTAAELLGAHSILCCSHVEHRLARRAVATLFSMPSTAAFTATFDRLASDVIVGQWRPRNGDDTATVQVVALDAALEISYGAICEMLVGKKNRLERVRGEVFAVTQAMLALPLRWVPGSRFRRGLEARKRIMAALREEMAARQHEHDQHGGDLLSVLMQRRRQRHHHPDALTTEEQILDNILTLIIAGQVTTATAITWMLKYLSDNRHIQDKLRAEAVGVELKNNQAGLVTMQDLNGMEYAYKAVKESLRMATIVSWFPRLALDDCHLAGFQIRKDWIVNIDARSLHYDPAVFDNPTVFDPSRFNEEGSDDETVKKKKKKKGPSAAQQRRLLVFGAGSRTCLGMNLAKIMMLVFLYRLLTNFRWEMADDDTSLEKWAMFPRLKNGCPIRLTPINSSSQIPRES